MAEKTVILGEAEHNYDSILPPGKFGEFVSKNKFLTRLFAIKPLSQIEAESSEETAELKYKKALGPWDLTSIGIGGIIGAGIFVLTGRAAKLYAGPGLILSYVIAGVVSGLAALCYSEMASMIPISGSAYTYTYATLGELMGWVIGWDLILEYGVGAATVAVGWSAYFERLWTDIFGWGFDDHWSNAPVYWGESPPGFYVTTFDDGSQAYFNAPAFIISILLTLLLVFGVKESARVNAFFVVVKVLVVVVFILTGIKYINPINYQPFVPPTDENGGFGGLGVFRAATIVFFAYIGFDAVSTTAQEARNPQRDLPIGIITSLVVCTALYISTVAVLTGVQKYTEIDPGAPIVSALTAADPNLKPIGIVINIGAVAGLTSVMLITLLGQTRIFATMAADGLLPRSFGFIHPKFKTPWVSTIVTGLFTAVASALLPIDILGNMASVGTLFAFGLVSIAVMVLRWTQPDRPRKFVIPGGKIIGGYVLPFLGLFGSWGLIFVSDPIQFSRLFIWMGLGLLIYAFFGFWKSKLRNYVPGEAAPVAVPAAEKA